MLQGRRPTRDGAQPTRRQCLPLDAVLRCLLAALVLVAGCSGTSAPEPESGPFTAVAAGSEHVCGLQDDDTIVCWGNNASGQVDVPDGEFSAVTSGGEHSCALRTDGTAVCWGSNRWGQIRAPDGRFSAVAAGGEHTCALDADERVVCWGSRRWFQRDGVFGHYSAIAAGGRHSCALRVTDQTAVCWGDNSYGQVRAPEGAFTAVHAGDSHSCGLRTHGVINCWGDDTHGQTQAPPGRFSAVVAGGNHTCGLRIDGTISCWGHNGYGQAEDPDGEFAALSVGHRYSCGVRTGGIINCWGDLGDARSTAPEGQFSAISAGERHSCGVRADSAIVCWGDERHGRTLAPEGSFSAVAAGSTHSCGLDIDGSVACWGDNGSGESDPPSERFSAVSAGSRYSCGLQAAETLACWGDNGSGESDPPPGRFTQVSSGSWHACGVRADGLAACWGNNSNGQARAPRGEFVAAAAGTWHSCGLRTDKTIHCWGIGNDGQLIAPAGEFDEVTAGTRHSCGLRTDGTVACWGANEAGQSSPPTGRFSAVTAGDKHSCGLRIDGTAICWGIEWTPSPPGARHIVLGSQADPANCRPYGGSDHVTAGFPRPPEALDATGRLRVAVLFLDFPDKAAGYPVSEEAELGLPFMRETLESLSYGSLEIEFIPSRSWLRAEHSHDHYLRESEGTSFFSREVVSEAVRLADPHFDFGRVDAVMTVLPSVHFSGGTAQGSVETDEGRVARSARVNAFDHDRQDGRYLWGPVATHEFLHLLGLVDMYPFDFVEPPERPDGEAWIYGSFGLMGLYSLYLAPADDLPPTVVRYDSDGRSLEEAAIGSHASEMLAWSRWQLDWLAEHQIICVHDDQASFDLAPVADPGTGIAMAAVPLSGHEVIVLESRRQIGLDLAFEEPFPDGGGVVQPALLKEGVLVYTVDASMATGEVPIRLMDHTGDLVVSGYPVLGVGESETVRGYTIAVVADDGDTHTVTVAKTSGG